MEILQWSAAAVLALIGAYVIIGNWSIPIIYYLRGKRASLVPLIGGVCFACTF